MTVIAALLLGVLSQDQDRIQDLIRKLGSDDFETREKATEDLKKAGKTAKDALLKASEESEDPEVRQRSKTILEEMARAEKPAPRRIPLPQPGQGGGFGFRGSSVTIRSVNGDSVYTITPGDGSPALTFHKAAAGAVKLEYKDDQGEAKTVEAPTLEAFLKDHKELAGKFGISEEGIHYSGSRVSFKGNGLPGFEFPRVPRVAPRVPPPAPPPALDDEDDGVPVAGARLGAVEDSLRAQLDIPEKQGAVVLGVTSGSLADTLGLRKNDVLLELDGKKITSPESAKGLVTKDSTGTVLRKGRKVAIGAKKDF
jgi:hypothetical protein